jgi:hypothetical protein
MFAKQNPTYLGLKLKRKNISLDIPEIPQPIYLHEFLICPVWHSTY